MNPEPFSHSAGIGLGSNLGRSKKLLQDAWQTLAGHPAISLQVLSSPWKTKPVGMESAHWCINAVGLLTTSLGPEELLALLLQVEQQFGRVRSIDQTEYQDRTLDLDLLFYDDLVLDTPELVLPHPAMHERLFVLVPLAEVAPQFYHPLQGRTVAELLAAVRLGSDRDDIEGVAWQE